MTAPPTVPTVPPAGQPAAPPDAPGEPPTTGRSLDPTGGDLWRRLRGPLAIVAAIVVAGVVIAAVQGRTTGGPLDPQSARQSGGRALATLLEARGVEVLRTRTVADAVEKAGPDTTLLVTQPELLAASQIDQLARTPARHVVVFEPGEEVLAAFAPKAATAGDAFPRTRDPDCDLDAAARAGAVRVEGPMYRALSGAHATTCYGDGTRGALVRLTGVPVSRADDSRRTVDVVGTSASLSNARLGDEGHAALGLNLLGDQQRVVWHVPSLGDVPQPPTGANGPQSLFALLPTGLRFGLVQIAVGVGLLMLAYARRLGPVVPEPLPVVVRASEAVEGRARLYHRARARARAAAALRDATRSRLSPLLGLPSGATPDTVTAAVSARTGRSGAQVAEVLGADPDGTGGDAAGPPDDAALVRLADDLDTLEQEVRRS